MDSAVRLLDTYPLDSDISVGWHYWPCDQLDPGDYGCCALPSFHCYFHCDDYVFNCGIIFKCWWKNLCNLELKQTLLKEVLDRGVGCMGSNPSIWVRPKRASSKANFSKI